MKVLLDENLPKRLKVEFEEHEIFTVREKGWNGKKNGELISLMMKDHFKALITFDQNLQHQQNFIKYPITVIVLIAEINTYDVLKRFVPKIRSLLSGEVKKQVIVLS